jgi:hypothetical protein
MGRSAWPPGLRQRGHSILVVILVGAGFRRWLSRPWQWSLRDYMASVAATASALCLSGSPMPTFVFVAIFALAVAICFRLPRYGFKFADVSTVLAIILLAAAFLLPAMAQTRSRTLGKQFFPSLMPSRFETLFKVGLRAGATSRDNLRNRTCTGNEDFSRPSSSGVLAQVGWTSRLEWITISSR